MHAEERGPTRHHAGSVAGFMYCHVGITIQSHLRDGDEHMIPLAGNFIPVRGKEQVKSDDTKLASNLAGSVAASTSIVFDPIV